MSRLSLSLFRSTSLLWLGLPLPSSCCFLPSFALDLTLGCGLRDRREEKRREENKITDTSTEKTREEKRREEKKREAFLFFCAFASLLFLLSLPPDNRITVGRPPLFYGPCLKKPSFLFVVFVCVYLFYFSLLIMMLDDRC